MKNIKYILIFILSIGLFNSCLVEDEADIDLNDQGNNIAGFADATSTVSAISDGTEYTFDFIMKVGGPTWSDISSDVTVTVAADAAASTAIEGTHFRIDNASVTLPANNNLIGKFSLVMLTDGIIAPLAVSPVVVLEVTSATGAVASGKTLAITLNYACPSVLAGTYDVTMVRDGGTVFNFVDYITETGTGTYRTSEVGHWIGGLGVGTPGFTFMDVCGVLTIPGQNLLDYYGNWVEGTEYGSVDPVTGTLHMVYSITSSGWSSTYDATYVKQ